VDGRILALGSVAALAALGVLGAQGSAGKSDPNEPLIEQIMEYHWPNHGRLVSYTRRLLDLPEDSVDKIWKTLFNKPVPETKKEEKVKDILDVYLPGGRDSVSLILRLNQIGQSQDGSVALRRILEDIASTPPLLRSRTTKHWMPGPTRLG